MWDKISLYKYQQLEKINERQIEDLDKSLYAACIVYGYTETQLNNMNPRKAIRLLDKMGKTLSKEIKPVAQKRIGKLFLSYNVSKMTFGQYIEIAYFLQMGSLKAAHYILASAAKPLIDYVLPNKYKLKHSTKAEYLLYQPIEKTLGSALQLIENFNNFNKGYKGLFGLKNGNEENEYDLKKMEEDPFNKQYGWIFSATQVAEHEGISLEKAFQLPVRQALNDLSFLKSKSKYIEKQIKKK